MGGGPLGAESRSTSSGTRVQGIFMVGSAMFSFTALVASDLRRFSAGHCAWQSSGVQDCSSWYADDLLETVTSGHPVLQRIPGSRI